MDIQIEDLIEPISGIWSSMLGVELSPLSGEASMDHTRTLTGCVHIAGDWVGAVTVKCPSDVAVQFAELMFGADPGTLEPDEISDALGELTNMTGGSVKGMIPGDCQLSLPTVAEGFDYTLSIPKAVPVMAMYFEADGEPLEVVVLEVKD